MAPGGPCADIAGSEPARLQPPPVALDIVEAHFCQTELALLEFAADQDEPLLLGLTERFQARAFRRRLPARSDGAVQQYHDFNNFGSPLPIEIIRSK